MVVLASVSTGVNAALVNDGSKFDLYSLPDNSLSLDEQKVYVNQATVGQGEHLTGSIGANDGAVEAYWYSMDPSGLDGTGNGFAVIKAGDGGLIHDITFGIYNGYFEDVIFSVIPENQQSVNFTFTGYFADGSSEAVDLTTANGLEDWLALVDFETNPFSKINISSTTGVYIAGKNNGDATSGGFTETKQWEVSGVTGGGSVVPIPAAAPLFASALGVLNLVAWRKRRGDAQKA